MTTSRKKIFNFSINDSLDEIGSDIKDILTNERVVLLDAPPSTGKTTLIAKWCSLNHKNRPFNKIVFCSPFIIIQEQYKNRVEGFGSKIDLTLNYKNKRLYRQADKNITCTFHSLHKIENDINRDDLIVVDEAHLLYNAFRVKKVVQVYDEFIRIIKETNATILLMSGTPLKALKYLLDFKIIRVKKPISRIDLTIDYTKHNYLEYLQWFAESNHRDEDPKLNVIYIKNKKRCKQFHTLLSKLGYISNIFNSDYKNTKEFKEFAENSIIDPKIEFLITTNIITTGANVLNENIGNALVFDNYSIDDLTQFGRRFRSKSNIKIHLVNRANSAVKTLDDSELDTLSVRAREVRSAYKGLYIDIKKRFNNIESLEFDRTYHNSLVGTRNHLLNCTINRQLVEESWFINEYEAGQSDLNNMLQKLKKSPVFNATCFKPELKQSISAVDLEKLEFSRLDYLIDKFIKNLEQFINAIHYYVEDKKDYEIMVMMNSLDNPLPEYRTTSNYYEELNDGFVYSHVLKPFMLYLPYIGDPEKTLNFLKNIKKEAEREKYRYTLHFNSEFNRHFELQGIQDLKDLKKNSNVISEDMHNLSMATIRLLEITIEYFKKNNYLQKRGFERYLKKNFRSRFDLNSFPFDDIHFKKSTKNKWKIDRMPHSFPTILMQSIFVISDRRTQLRTKGSNSDIYLPKQNDPTNSISIKKLRKLRFNQNNISKTKSIQRVYLADKDYIVERSLGNI